MRRKSLYLFFAVLALLALSAGNLFAGEGIISIDQVEGAVGHDTIQAGQHFRVVLRLNNDVGLKCDISNGWKISTADGATWDSVTLDTAGPIVSGENRFAIYFNQVFNLWTGPLQAGNGSNPDTVGIIAAGNPGTASRQMPAAYNDTALAIIVWTTGSSSHGKHICIDTSFWTPGGTWVWVDRNLVNHYPTFVGLPGQAYNNGDGDRFGSGYCFLIWDQAQGVNDGKNPTLPTQFGLGQNFPNPFNPTTTIKFEIPTRSHVSLNIYNVLGQKVKTLVNEDMAAKSYEKTWDGSSDAGSKVASGIYFYKIEAGSFTQTKKMILMK